VRAPSRLDREIFFPANPPFIVAGGPQFDSEISDAYEVGYRARPWGGFSYSITLFRQEYERLKSAELTNGALPFVSANRARGAVEGLETWAYWQAVENWRLSAGYTKLDDRLTVEEGSADPAGPRNLGNNPNYQWMLRSALTLAGRTEFDVNVRRVASLPPFPGNARTVPAYTAVDLRLARNLSRELRLALIVQNAFERYHREWGDTTASAEIARIIALRASWQM
jgi:iron complex outermembrane receptor protein